MDKFPFLDNGFVSKCHYAPIRIGFKKMKNSDHRLKVWVCLSCKKKDIPIIPREEMKSQIGDEEEQIDEALL